jgi:hypothetical protein
MDIKQILLQAFAPMIAIYWWLFVLLIVISFLKTPFIKGVIGEALVNLAAALFRIRISIAYSKTSRYRQKTV